MPNSQSSHQGNPPRVSSMGAAGARAVSSSTVSMGSAGSSATTGSASASTGAVASTSEMTFLPRYCGSKA